MSRKGFTPIILLVIIGILVLGGVILWYMNQTKPLPQIPGTYPIQLSASSTAIAPSNNAASSWQTYHDDQYHFSFQYPSNFTLDISHFKTQSSQTLPIQPFPAEIIFVNAPYKSHQNINFVINENDTVERITSDEKKGLNFPPCTMKNEKIPNGTSLVVTTCPGLNGLPGSAYHFQLQNKNALTMAILINNTSTDAQDIPQSVFTEILNSISANE